MIYIYIYVSTYINHRYPSSPEVCRPSVSAFASQWLGAGAQLSVPKNGPGSAGGSSGRNAGILKMVQ